MRVFIALAGLLVGVCLYAAARYFSKERKLAAAWREYDEILRAHGSQAKELCPHRLVEFGQTGVAGVVTMTTKWCRTCKKHLGAAKLVESFWGNRWE